MVFETLGGVNEQGEKVLRQLFTFASKKLGHELALTVAALGDECLAVYSGPSLGHPQSYRRGVRRR